jgi:sortase A
MLGWVFYKPILEEVKYFANQITHKTYITVEEENDTKFKIEKGSGQSGILSGILNGKNVEVLVPVDPNFSIVIPKLGANANVIPNVNVADKNQYLDALKKGVAHAEGTKFPGERGHIYMFAHSTNTFSNVSRYNAVFYLLYKLEIDDEIDVYYKGVRYKYRVTGKEIVDPSQTQYLTRKTDTEFLTLQTCWPPGTIAKRMLIFAEPN